MNSGSWVPTLLFLTEKSCSVLSVGYNSSSECWIRLSKRNSECLISHVDFLNRQENSTRELSLKHSGCFMPRIFLDHSLSFVKRLTIPTLPLYLNFLSNPMLWSLCLKVRGLCFFGWEVICYKHLTQTCPHTLEEKSLTVKTNSRRCWTFECSDLGDTIVSICVMSG